MANTILVKGRGIRKEAKARGTVTPGMLLDYFRSGDTYEVRAHADANGNHNAAFAVEDELHGNEIDVNYTAGENVVYEVMPRGTEVLAWLAPNQGATVGDFLSSNGDGRLRELGTISPGSNIAESSNALVGIALQNVASAGTNRRVLIEVV